MSCRAALLFRSSCDSDLHGAAIEMLIGTRVKSIDPPAISCLVSISEWRHFATASHFRHTCLDLNNKPSAEWMDELTPFSGLVRAFIGILIRFLLTWNFSGCIFELAFRPPFRCVWKYSCPSGRNICNASTIEIDILRLTFAYLFFGIASQRSCFLTGLNILDGFTESS